MFYRFLVCFVERTVWMIRSVGSMTDHCLLWWRNRVGWSAQLDQLQIIVCFVDRTVCDDPLSCINYISLLSLLSEPCGMIRSVGSMTDHVWFCWANCVWWSAQSDQWHIIVGFVEPTELDDPLSRINDRSFLVLLSQPCGMIRSVGSMTDHCWFCWANRVGWSAQSDQWQIIVGFVERTVWDNPLSRINDRLQNTKIIGFQ